MINDTMTEPYALLDSKKTGGNHRRRRIHLTLFRHANTLARPVGAKEAVRAVLGAIAVKHELRLAVAAVILGIAAVPVRERAAGLHADPARALLVDGEAGALAELVPAAPLVDADGVVLADEAAVPTLRSCSR